MIKGANVYYYHYDGLGSVRAITDSSESVIETYTYDIYGKPTIYDASGTKITESQPGNRFYFTGREFDKETGLYYYRARYYNPELGRFMSPDPMGPVDGPNLYTYCKNDPLNWVDPYGLFSGKEVLEFLKNWLKDILNRLLPYIIPPETVEMTREAYPISHRATETNQASEDCGFGGGKMYEKFPSGDLY